MKQLKSKGSGLLRRGDHHPQSILRGQTCALEFYNLSRTGGPDLGDEPFDNLDVRVINDMFKSAELRTVALLPVLAAYEGIRHWSKDRKRRLMKDASRLLKKYKYEGPHDEWFSLDILTSYLFNERRSDKFRMQLCSDLVEIAEKSEKSKAKRKAAP